MVLSSNHERSSEALPTICIPSAAECEGPTHLGVLDHQILWLLQEGLYEQQELSHVHVVEGARDVEAHNVRHHRRT